MVNELSKFRNDIDKLDSQMMKILEKRFEVCKKVGVLKKKNGIKIYDKKREQEIINSKTKKTKLRPKFVRKLFETILKESKELMKNGK